MEDMIDVLYDAHDIAISYKRRGENGILNEPMKYNVPRVAGIHRGQWDKDINGVKPNTLYYIIYTLHNVDEDMLQRAVITLLYYWRIRKRNKMIELKREFEEILHHYSSNNSNEEISVGNDKRMKFYLLEINIGARGCYKLGFTSEPMNRRVATIRSTIANNYELISSSVNVVDVWHTDDAKEIEAELKEEHKDLLGSKFYFNGRTECFTDEMLVEKIRNRLDDNW